MILSLNRVPYYDAQQKLLLAAWILACTVLTLKGAPVHPPIQWMNGGHPDGISAVALSSDGAMLASAGSGYTDRTIKLWRTSDGYLLKEWEALPYDGNSRGDATAMAFSPDGSKLAVANERFSIQIWRIFAHLVRPYRLLQ